MINLDSKPTFGFESPLCNYDNAYGWRNLTKLASYIPILGTVIGIYKLAHLQRTFEDPTISNKKAYVFRAAVESLSLGSIFIFFDLPASVSLFKCKETPMFVNDSNVNQFEDD